MSHKEANNNLKFKLIIKLLTILVLSTVFFGCKKSNRELEEWAVYHLIYNEVDLLEKQKENIVFRAIPLFIDYQNDWFILDLEKRVKAKFKLKSIDKNYYFIDINQANDKRFNDRFIMKIDTVKSTKSSYELRIIIESDKLHLVGKRTLFEGFGNGS